MVVFAYSWKGQVPLMPSGIFLVGHLAFPFIPFHEAVNEQLFRHRVELHASGLSIADKLVVVFEVDRFDDRAGCGA